MTEEETFAVRIVRTAPDGERETIEWDGYGLLHELLEAIISEAGERGWLQETPI
jgi:hypothetical protein